MFSWNIYGLVSLCVITGLSCAFELTLLHTNDVHARVEQVNKYGGSCADDDAADGKCFGGVARRMTKVREIRASHDHVLLLDAGDQFLGTLWFTYYKGMAASFFMKEIGYDVMCLGNHEFDLGVDGLVTFIDNVTFPVVSANTDVSGEPRLQGKFASSHVFTVDGEKIGVIGYTTPKTKYTSDSGPTVHFSDILTSVEAEATRLSNDGVNKIIALGHAGYAMDQQVALLDTIDVVIGGHTDTFLYTGDAPSRETAEGEYPTVVTKQSGSKGLVVQAFTWGKYLGYLNVSFDSAGEVTAYAGNPILLDNTEQQDPGVLQEVDNWAVPLQQIITEEIGHTNVLLDGTRQACRLRECSMGNLLTDATVDYYLSFVHSNSSWAPAAIALSNGGGIRASLNKGRVTQGDVMRVQPFLDVVDLIEIRGSNLREQLELSVREWNPDDPHGRFLQVSGLKIEYNLTKPIGKRVVSVQVRCRDCDIPSYSPLMNDARYSVFTSSFLIEGGDGYSFDPIRHERFNTLDSDIPAAYFKKHSPVYTELQGRIKFLIGGDPSSAGSTTCTVLIIAVMTTIACLW